MTVAELIDLLERVEDKSQKVMGEGCDCINPVTGVGDFAGSVLIEVET